MFFFVKQKTAYEMRISDWSSDVCSSDLSAPAVASAPFPNDEGRMAMSWAPSILAPWRLAYGLRKHPSTILLIVQVLGLLSYPLMENTGAGREVFGAMSLAVLSLVRGWVYRAHSHRVGWRLGTGKR